MKKKILLLIPLLLCFMLSTANAGYIVSDSGIWGVKAHSDTYLSSINGTWGIKAGFPEYASSENGTWGIKTYIEYFIWSEWSDYWVLPLMLNNVSASKSLVELNGVCNRGNYTTTLTWDIYAPLSYTVSQTVTSITNNSNQDSIPSSTISYTQDGNIRHYTTVYDPSNTLSDADMGFFDLNISAIIQNATVVYSGYNTTENLFQVYELDPAYNSVSGFNSTWTSINTSWTSGNNSDTNVVVRNNDSYPVCPSDGYEVQNNSGNYYNTSVAVEETYCLVVFSYNDTTHSYSEPLLLPWGGVQLQCYNESNSSQALTFNIEISNKNGSDVYYGTGISNGYSISVDEIPFGNGTGILVSGTGYKNRKYIKNLLINHFYNFSFYLPPEYTEGGGGGGDTPCDNCLRLHTDTSSISDHTTDETIDLNYIVYEIDTVSKYEMISHDRMMHADSKTVTDPSNNLIMVLNFTCDEIYRCVAYENLESQDIYTDSIGVTDPTSDINITFSQPYSRILGVYKFNDTIYGGWIWIASSNYTYDATNVTVNESVLDDNISMVKVQYTVEVGGQGVVEIPISGSKITISGDGTTVTIDKSVLNSNTSLVRLEYYTNYNEFYQWILIPSQKYTNTSTAVTVNETELTENTLILKVVYWTYDVQNNIETQLYIIRVINVLGVPVNDATVIIKRYMDVTGQYEEVASYLTDGNGQIEVFLIPFANYKIVVQATGYSEEVNDYTPSNSVFVHTISLTYLETTPTTTETVFDGITWDIVPHDHYQNGNFTFCFNITSSDNKLEWFRATISVLNQTTGAWDVLYTANNSISPGGGSICYTVEDANLSNITGKYKIDCWYKKENFPEYEVVQVGSDYIWITFPGLSSELFDAIPDWVFLLIVVLIMAVVMGFLMPITGLATGYIGIGIFALSLLLKPDLVINNVMGWAILVVTILVYTLALFLWSRI